MVSKTSHRKSTSGVPRACHAGHCRLCFFIVIPGLRPGNPNQTNFLLVIAGLDPAIQVNHKANLFIWILGSSPRMTVLLYLSQKMLEQRGLCGTMLPIERRRSHRSPPGFFLSSSPGIDPGIQINNKANLLTWIAGSSPAMTVLKNNSPSLLRGGMGELEMPFNEYFLVFVKKRKLKILYTFLPS